MNRLASHIVVLALIGLILVFGGTTQKASEAEAGFIPPQVTEAVPSSYGPSSFTATQVAGSFTLDAPDNQWQTVKYWQYWDNGHVPNPSSSVYLSEPNPGLPTVPPGVTKTEFEVGVAVKPAMEFGKIDTSLPGCGTLKESLVVTGTVNPLGQARIDNTAGGDYYLWVYFSDTQTSVVVAPGAVSQSANFISENAFVVLFSWTPDLPNDLNWCSHISWNFTETWLGIGATWASPSFKGWKVNDWLPGATNALLHLEADSDKTTTISLSTSTTCSGMVFEPSTFTINGNGIRLNTTVNVSVHPSTSHGALCPIYTTGMYGSNPYPGPVEITVVTIS